MGTPLAPSPSPNQLRERARRLRQFAWQCEHNNVLGLRQLVGPDTWLGPRPDDCAADIARLVARFSLAAAEIRNAARLLELEANAGMITSGPS